MTLGHWTTVLFRHVFHMRCLFAIKHHVASMPAALVHHLRVISSHWRQVWRNYLILGRLNELTLPLITECHYMFRRQWESSSGFVLVTYHRILKLHASKKFSQTLKKSFHKFKQYRFEKLDSSYWGKKNGINKRGNCWSVLPSRAYQYRATVQFWVSLLSSLLKRSSSWKWNLYDKWMIFVPRYKLWDKRIVNVLFLPLWRCWRCIPCRVESFCCPVQERMCGWPQWTW